MFLLIIYGAVIVMALGLIAKLVLDYTQSEHRIYSAELAIATPILLIIVVPLIMWLGTKLAISNLVTYHENWGGYETSAQWIKSPCERDGNMKYYYKGDPYVVEWDEDVSYTDSRGKRHHKTVHHKETRYHNIPYCSEEWSFVVHTTLGDYTIADHNLPENPNAYRYRSWVSVPDDMPHGTPEFWTLAKHRLDEGKPGPVTARRDYDNYILASQNSILKRFNGSVGAYKKAGLLPALSNNPIHEFYLADRVYMVGTHPSENWQTAINRFDAALGNMRQGDLHLVIVDANSVPDPDNYIGALMAYWESPTLGKDALSKNGIVVVLGTKDNKTVSWARAATGMPAGNELMLLDIEHNLQGTALSVDSILGRPMVNLGTHQWSNTQSVLEQAVLWGPDAFVRVHMGKLTDKGASGYAYLLREIEPKGWQRFWMLFTAFVAGCITWGICIAHGTPMARAFVNSGSIRNYRTYRRS
jgi:hypothetical protein